MKKNHILLIFISLFVLFILLNIILILPKMLSQNQSYDIATQAIENECSYCLNEPPCCAKMVQNSDMHECDWPIRGYCQLSTCHSVDVPKQERCGWYWIWHDAGDNSYQLGNNSPNGYGCMIGNSESTIKPRCTAAGPITLAPTGSAPSPTTYILPTVAPTAIPQPTESLPTPTPLPQPTAILRVPPNEMHPTVNTLPTAGPITSSPQFEFPSINLPKTQINLPKINQLARKPLDLFEYLFLSIVNYDKQLENTINGEIRKIVK